MIFLCQNYYRIKHRTYYYLIDLSSQYDNRDRNIFQTSIPNQEHKYVDLACEKQTLKKSELWDLESIDDCNRKP